MSIVQISIVWDQHMHPDVTSVSANFQCVYHSNTCNYIPNILLPHVALVKEVISK